jgi:plasmid stabilization system protein ParE
MSLALFIRSEAERDMSDARDWYEARREGLGGEFLDAVDDVFARIERFPESYAAVYRGVRPARLRRFPYVVYYRVTHTNLEILGVLHGSRHARAWRSRA